MARIAFVTWAGGGNVTPALQTAVRMRDRGHHAMVIGPLSLGERVTNYDLEFIPRLVPNEWDSVLMATGVRDLVERRRRP